MTSSGKKLSYVEGARLTQEMLCHNNESGGITAGLYGSKGSGKTTLLLTIAQTVTCINPLTGEREFETVLWRGGTEDYWNWLPKENVFVFIHRDDFERFKVLEDLTLQEIPRKDLPTLIEYSSIKDLYSKLKRQQINVIYEPTTYKLTNRIKTMIQKRGVTGDELFKNKSVDPIIFWFELVDWLIKNKAIEFLTIIIDETDQLLPQSPSGARWHLNLWFRDVMRAFRKRNMSLFLACHGFTDIDGRIHAKIMIRVYMKGTCTPNTSLIYKTAPVTLPQGTYYIERDAWGIAKFRKITEQSRVIVKLEGDEIDLEGDVDEPLTEKDAINIDFTQTKSRKKLFKPKDILNSIDLTKLPSDCVHMDKDGRLVFDLKNIQPLDEHKKSDITLPKKITKPRNIKRDADRGGKPNVDDKPQDAIHKLSDVIKNNEINEDYESVVDEGFTLDELDKDEGFDMYE
jgi:hypothetical protein